MNANRVFSLLLVFFTFFLCAVNTQAQDVQIPAPVGDIYVQDFANVLNETERAELINLGRNIEDQTTAQIAVLTVETIGDRTIEEFANEAFRQYGIGNKRENNGVLIVLSMQDRKVRIEVGYGLEGRIPDGKAGRILDEYAIPYLKNQQPDKAIVETYKVLANEVLAEYGKNGEVSKQTTDDKGIGIPSWLLVIVVIVVVFFDFKFFGGTLTYLLLSIISRGGGRGGGGGGSGGSRGGGGGSSG
ncbi:TPM domain-containing protein, partial [Neobacillus drentensis]|uniref:TPM domain-containing protein n=1 Tax=Neobacillus drentensis TaxID=220684 RepID=UPI00300308B5